MGWETDDTDQSRSARGPLWSIRRFGVLGGGLIAMGSVLPWIRYEADSFYAEELREAGLSETGSLMGIHGTAGVVVLLVGLLLALLAFRRHRSGAHAVGMGMGAGVALTVVVPAVLEPTSVTFGMEQLDPIRTMETYRPSFGLYLSLVGCVVVAATAFVLGDCHR